MWLGYDEDVVRDYLVQHRELVEETTIAEANGAEVDHVDIAELEHEIVGYVAEFCSVTDQAAQEVGMLLVKAQTEILTLRALVSGPEAWAARARGWWWKNIRN